MSAGPPRDRRNRKWGTLKDAVWKKVKLPRRTVKILAALRTQEEGQQVSYGAVIEKLAEPFAGLVKERKTDGR